MKKLTFQKLVSELKIDLWKAMRVANWVRDNTESDTAIWMDKCHKLEIENAKLKRRAK